MEGFLSSLLPTLLVLGVLIFIHELGHFMACKLVGVAVEKFSIGFGPELAHFQYKETRVAVSLIPFGGFVKPKGESLEEGSPKDLDPDAYLAKGIAAKSFIVSAGVIMNFILAFVLFVFIFVAGRPVLQPIVGELVEGYPAKEAGILPGDRILSIDGKEIKDWNTLTMAILTHPGGAMNLVLNREGRVETLSIVPQQEMVEGVQGKQKIKRIGIKPSHEVEVVKVGFGEAVVEGIRTVKDFTFLTYRVLWGLVTGEISFKNIAGPIGIMAIAGQTAKQGILSLLQLMALLSVNLAVINLLPIPALDGGHLFFLMIEGIRRKAISQEFQERMTQVGFVFLMGLMVFIVFNDIQNFGIAAKIKNIFIH